MEILVKLRGFPRGLVRLSWGMITAFPPCPSRFNMAAHVLRHADDLADKPALIVLGDQAEVWSYGRMAAAVRGIGTGLLALGLRPGDRVLMRLGNTPAFPLLFLGAIAVGLVPVPTSAALTAVEITAMARAVAPALIVAGEAVAVPELEVPLLAEADLMAMAALRSCDYLITNSDQMAYIVFTSGTSGRPMAVAHAHRALWARGMMHQGWQGLRLADRLLHAGAFNWTYTLGTGLLDPWTLGATALIPAQNTPAADLGRLLAQSGATIFAAAPGVYRQMLKTALPSLPHLRHGLSAGEALPPALRAAWRTATCTDVHEALGLSECSTFLSGSPMRPAPLGSAGYPQPGRRIAVLDDLGRPANEGILAIHRSDPGLMLGYLDDPEATAARHSGDWFLTGDRVAQNPDGTIRYLGRTDDMMNAGGYRVSPLEVEAALVSCPGLHDCAVVEVPGRDGSRIIACFYTAATDLSATLPVHAAAYLARYKQPRRFIRLDALPRNANNKLNRRALTLPEAP